MGRLRWPFKSSSNHASYGALDDSNEDSSDTEFNESSNPYGDTCASDPVFQQDRITFLNWSRTHPEDVYYWALRLAWIGTPISFFSVTTCIMLIIVFIAAFLGWIDADHIFDPSQPNGQVIHPSFGSILVYFFLIFNGGTPTTSWQLNSAYLTIVASTLSLVRVAFFTLVTALLYARFARPVSRIRFSSTCVIGTLRGNPVIMVRLANDRLDALLNSEVKLTLAYNTINGYHPMSKEQRQNQSSQSWRIYTDLKLSRTGLPLFLLPWTVFHVIDSSSPLYGMDEAIMQTNRVQLHVSVTAHDLVFAGTIYARKTYLPEDFRWNAKYADVITVKDDNHRIVDMSKMDKIVYLSKQRRVDEEKATDSEQISVLINRDSSSN